MNASSIESNKNSDLAAAERIICTNYALLPYMLWDKAKNYWFNVIEMWPLEKGSWDEFIPLQTKGLGKENKLKVVKKRMNDWTLITDD